MDMIAFLMGWPSLITALFLAMAGGWRRRPAFIWIAVVLTLPMACYLFGSPRFFLAGLIPLAALAVAALTCRRKTRWPVISAIAAYALLLGVLALVVLSAPSS